ncbi:MAG: DUF998 domain-containing protein [Nitrososphaerota archaeon]|nr:DUF998 domain-containing protein [Nitrososphaerota archaeon]
MRARVTGLAAAWTSYPFIAAAIAISPWFNIYNNALSDLGNYARQGLNAAVFNLGLIISGALAVLTAVLIIRSRRHRLVIPWAVLIFLAGTDLVLVGILSEDFGEAHWVVSVILFTLFGLALLVYGVCSLLSRDWVAGGYALAAGLVSAAVWAANWPWRGVAIQELIASLLVSVGLTIMVLKYG